MALNDDIALLSIVPLFSDISEDKLRLIAFGAERRKLQAGQMLFREGTPADCAFVVASGRFELSRTGKEGQAITLGFAERGTLLGELAMVTPNDDRHCTRQCRDHPHQPAAVSSHAGRVSRHRRSRPQTH